jgi:protocatechuate 3,4-dioxygenase beta subunit
MISFVVSIFLPIFIFISTAFAEEIYNNGQEIKPIELPEFTDLHGDIVNNFSKESPSLFTPKTPTPSRFFAADLSMPDEFSTTNNLVKKTGSFYRAFGEVIFLQGTITDSFGVPIEGVIIEIWQANAAGKYHTLLEQNSEYIDRYFSMSGRTVSDNMGNYHFITIMPGARLGRAPHINMNIYHSKFGKLETEMYFSKHPYNSSDYQFMAYDESEQKLLTASVRHSDINNPNSVKLCTFNIVIKGIHQYKHH